MNNFLRIIHAKSWVSFKMLLLTFMFGMVYGDPSLIINNTPALGTTYNGLYVFAMYTSNNCTSGALYNNSTVYSFAANPQSFPRRVVDSFQYSTMVDALAAANAPIPANITPQSIKSVVTGVVTSYPTGTAESNSFCPKSGCTSISSMTYNNATGLYYGTQSSPNYCIPVSCFDQQRQCTFAVPMVNFLRTLYIN